jgi:hypothetical protein
MYLLIAIVLIRTASGQDDTREKQKYGWHLFCQHVSKNSESISFRNFFIQAFGMIGAR